jgi:glycosyltransferase involved in cell wall biosynthesis
VTELQKQITNVGQDQVELLYLGDNKKRTVGQKRNNLLQIAAGDYVCFVDDDDMVAPDYVAKILPHLDGTTDVICFQSHLTWNGAKMNPTYFSKAFPRNADYNDRYERLPNHLMPVRRALALQVGYHDITVHEDNDYSDRLKPLLKSEKIIPEILYHYIFDVDATEAQPLLKVRYPKQKPQGDMMIHVPDGPDTGSLPNLADSECMQATGPEQPEPSGLNGGTGGSLGIVGTPGVTGPVGIPDAPGPTGPHPVDCVLLAYSKTSDARKMTQAAIDSLHASTDAYQFNVMVIETQAGDVQYKGATVIQPEIPFNYNAYLNIGFARCTADRVIIANNDLVFHKGWYEEMMKVNADSMSPWTDGYPAHNTLKDKIIPGYQVSYLVCGWCIVVKKSVLDKIGKFDEQFDFWFQDNDYAMQLLRHQAQHVFVGTSWVTHLYSQSHKLIEREGYDAKTKGAQAKFDAKYGNPTVCLTMIVKDESAIILDMLKSVIKYINHWVIVDTGSTDGTQKIITDFFATHPEIPGTLYERPWVNFGHNRTESMQLADGKADYMWVMDADDRVQGNLSFKGLMLDTYSLRMGKEFSHWRNQIFRSGLEWKYVGVLHEYAHSALSKTNGRLQGDYWMEARCAGKRASDPLKYQKDAALLEEALKTDPENSRNWFYLGQSYFDYGDFVNSKRCYEKRVTMGGWPEEVFYAQFRVGQCCLNMKYSDEAITAAMLKAYEIRPQRAESLHLLSKYMRHKNKFALGYIFAKTAAGIPVPENDSLFVFRNVYQFEALDELGISAFYTGRFKEAVEVFQWILDEKLAPPAQLERAKTNLKFAQDRLTLMPKSQGGTK